MAIVLLMEDDAVTQDAVFAMLESAGHTVLRGRTGLGAKADVLSLSYDLLVTDVVMPLVDGFELIRLSRQRNPTMAIITISGGSRALRAESALRLAGAMGVDVALEKPIKRAELVAAVERLTKRA